MKTFLKIIILSLLGLVFMVGNVPSQPAKVRSVNSEGQFDVQRAVGRIKIILGDEQPHPVDSLANDFVRERLIKQIENLGFKPIVTHDPACYARPNLSYSVCAQVKNISFLLEANSPKEVARTDESLQKNLNQNLILATSHYDSVGAGPGAADAQIGVAVLLEAAFHLSQKNIERPILFLITDGEEVGLLGARAFAQSDPRMQSVKTIVNFEARGTSGPAYMFETSQPNGKVIPAFMKEAKRPVASSLMASIYERLPNSTDVAVYLPGGYEALNFAVIGNETYYHTPLDNIENLSLPSVQHMGDLGLSTLLTLGENHGDGHNNKLIYSDILSIGMIALPQGIAMPVLILSVLIAGFGFWQVTRKSQTHFSMFYQVRIFITPLLMLIAVGIVSYGIQIMIGSLRVEPDHWRAHAWASQGWTVMVSILGAIIIPKLISPKAARLQLLTGGWVWFCIVGIIFSIILPGSAILFVPAALFFIIGGVAVYLWMPTAIILEMLAAIAALVFLAPSITTIGMAMGYEFAFVISILTAITLLPWIAVLMPDQTTVKAKILSARAIPLIGGLGLLAGFVGLSLVLPAYSEKFPRHLNILTLIDHAEQKAFVSFGNAKRLPEVFNNVGKIENPKNIVPFVSGRVWHHPLNYNDVSSQKGAAPRPILMNDIISSNGDRKLTVAFTLSQSQRLEIILPKEAKLKEIEYDGLLNTIKDNIEPAFNSAVFRCEGRSCNEQPITFTLGSHEPQNWLIIGSTYGAGAAGQAFIDVRPRDAVPRQSGDRVLHINRFDL